MDDYRKAQAERWAATAAARAIEPGTYQQPTAATATTVSASSRAQYEPLHNPWAAGNNVHTVSSLESSSGAASTVSAGATVQDLGYTTVEIPAGEFQASSSLDVLSVLP